MQYVMKDKFWLSFELTELSIRTLCQLMDFSSTSAFQPHPNKMAIIFYLYLKSCWLVGSSLSLNDRSGIKDDPATTVLLSIFGVKNPNGASFIISQI